MYLAKKKESVRHNFNEAYDLKIVNWCIPGSGSREGTVPATWDAWLHNK